MAMAVLNLQSLYDQMRSQIDHLNDNIEPGEYFTHSYVSHMNACCTIHV